MKIEKFTIGMGDRFAREGVAQLRAVQRAASEGIPVHPVWNKSRREHSIVGTEPVTVRAEADAAVAALGWERPYYVDADHIGLATVEPFIGSSDFFTIDVADLVGKPCGAESRRRLAAFVARWGGVARVEGIPEPLALSAADVDAAASKFLRAMEEAGTIYRFIAERKGAGAFVTEVSVDETDSAQTPGELLLILAMLAMEGVPVQTVAPKFTGRFNKGVDYVGDLGRFEREFDEDLAVIAFAVREFGLPETLKLSVHSGSDKFSIYPIINRLLRKHGCGIHLKTAGTTWLEEVIGLAEAGGSGLDLVKELYAGAVARFEELAAPYATVIDIDPARLPEAGAVAGWSAEKFAATLRHDPACPDYNPHFRQLLHIGFKVAARMGGRYLGALDAAKAVIERCVTDNLYRRHIVPVFQGL